jgi:uncharacterized protein YecT (DUF1311 family)
MVFLVCLAMLLACEAANGASFDCTKAQTLQEKAICASPELSAADDRMAAAYEALLAAAPAELKTEILTGQRAWIRGQAVACKPTGSGRDLSVCLKHYEEVRTQDLQYMVLRKGGVTFVWRSLTRTAPDDADTIKLNRERGVATDHGTLNASWPVAASSDPGWVSWNKAIEKATMGMAMPGQTPPVARWTDVSPADIDVDLNTSVNSVSPELVTAEMVNESFGQDAAHPSATSIQFNWLLKERRELQPTDVFKAGWAEMMQQRCDADLHKKLDQNGTSYESFEPPGEMAKTLGSIVADPENWQVDAEGVTIIYQEYAVACYACTPGPTTMSWKDLGPYLNPHFVVPR